MKTIISSNKREGLVILNPNYSRLY